MIDLSIAADHQAEEHVAAALVDGRATLQDMAGLRPEHFTSQFCGAVFAVALVALERGQLLDEASLANAMVTARITSRGVAVAALRQLAIETPVSFVPTVAEHAQRIRELAALRHLFSEAARFDILTRVAAKRGDPLPDPIPALREAVQALQAARGDQARSNVRALHVVRPEGSGEAAHVGAA